MAYISLQGKTSRRVDSADHAGGDAWRANGDDCFPHPEPSTAIFRPHPTLTFSPVGQMKVSTELIPARERFKEGRQGAMEPLFTVAHILKVAQAFPRTRARPDRPGSMLESAWCDCLDKAVC